MSFILWFVSHPIIAIILGFCRLMLAHINYRKSSAHIVNYFSILEPLWRTSMWAHTICSIQVYGHDFSTLAQHHISFFHYRSIFLLLSNHWKKLVRFETTKIILKIEVIFIESMLKVKSVQFSCSVVSDPLWPHEPQQARPPCPLPTSGVYPNPCPWVGDAIQPSHPLSSPSPPALNLSQH